MSMKPIRWSAHARKRAAAREIGQAVAEEAIRHPHSVEAGRPPRNIFARRYFDAILQTDMLVRVVVDETPAELAIVTIYKTSKLRKYLGSKTDAD